MSLVMTGAWIMSAIGPPGTGRENSDGQPLSLAGKISIVRSTIPPDPVEDGVQTTWNITGLYSQAEIRVGSQSETKDPSEPGPLPPDAEESDTPVFVPANSESNTESAVGGVVPARFQQQVV
ncbi:MAG TPA: hypothetical protein VHB77_08345, partial [Planctomycetaceae bacterium]|nr:hypothetical protein [Planctomycetaceae bacterium]